ncbi:hypothetical protein K8I61_15980 [bacterium]|nr:hypothetical protein [bacterium]
MKAHRLSLVIAALAALSMIALACGETDPANAPSHAQITFVGITDGEVRTITYTGMDDYGIPSSCFDVFQSLMIDYCKNFSQRADAEAFCEAGGWVDFVDQSVGGGASATFGDLARNALSTPGRCGYYEMIIAAFVFIPPTAGDQAGGTTTLVGEPMNDVEVRWIADPGMEMYEPQDVPGEIAPLANPFETRTDDRGLAELKIRVPLPVLPDTQSDYLIQADIGVDRAVYEIEMVGEDVDESTTTTDDDAADDDAG